MNTGTMLERKAAAEAILNAAQAAGRALTPAEDAQIAVAIQTGRLANAFSSRGRVNPAAYLNPVVGAVKSILNRQPLPSDVQLTPDGGIVIPSMPRADISETSFGSGVIPLPEIARTEAVVAVPSLDRAGATFLGGEAGGDIPFGDAALSQGVVFVVPSDTPPTQEAEGSGASGSNDSHVYAVRTGVPPIWDDQNKVDITFFQDAQPVTQAGLIANLIANLKYSIDATFVSTLITDVAAVNAIGSYGDLYTAALEAIAGVHSYFNDGSCCWVGGRAARKAFANVRNSFNQPIFAPASSPSQMDSLLGYPFILSEQAGSDCLFGNFRAGATIVRTGVYLQILRELYAESNQFGLKVLARAAMKSYPSVVPAGKPQPLSVIHTAEASS